MTQTHDRAVTTRIPGRMRLLVGLLTVLLLTLGCARQEVDTVTRTGSRELGDTTDGTPGP